MNDGTGLAEALLGLDGFRVLAVSETPSEVVIDIETTADFVGCSRCGTRAEPHERMSVEIRDLACFGRPARLVWNKRRWRCTEADCEAKTWTETSTQVSSRTVLTRRAGIEACHQVGANARAVASLARELGVCWWTVMEAVREHGTALVEAPGRVGPVTNLGVDETAYLAATATHPTLYATGLVDLDRPMIIDMVEGNSRLTCADGARPRAGGGWPASPRWPPTWPSPTAPDSIHTWPTPAGWPIRSTSPERPTAAWTPLGAGCRTRPLATGVARGIRSIGSASCCSPARSGSTTAAGAACC